MTGSRFAVSGVDGLRDVVRLGLRIGHRRKKTGGLLAAILVQRRLGYGEIKEMGDWRKAHVIGCKVWEGEYTCSCPPVRAILPNASIAEWCEAAHDNSVAHGFGDNPIPTRLMLIVTEAAEAMEEWRKQDDLWRDHFAEELADVCLRVFDLAEHMGLDLEAAIHKKHLYNLTRPFKHGGKLA